MVAGLLRPAAGLPPASTPIPSPRADKRDNLRPKAASSGALSGEEIAARAGKAVVVVECQTAGETMSLGSGFVVDRLGLIATNAHVVSTCDAMIVRTSETTSSRRARLISIDTDRDVAILFAAGVSTSLLPMGTSQGLRPGQRVFAIGHPEGLEYSISDGVVSAIRDISPFRLIQTTAPISPGSSGGPLLNGKGMVVGMTTMYLSVGQNLNFAVPAEYVAELARAASAWIRDHPAPAAPVAGLESGAEYVGTSLPPVISASSAARLGRAHRKAKNFAVAKSLLEAALNRFPENPDLLLQVAELSWDQQRFDDADVFTKRLLDADPNSASGRQVFSVLLYRKGMISEARSQAEKSLALNPDAEYASSAHVVLADCAASTKDFSTAAAHLAKALEYEEAQQNPALHAKYAVSLLRAGRPEEADYEARVATSIEPKNSYVRELLAKWKLPRGATVVSYAEEWDYDRNYFVKGVVTNEGSQRLQRVRVIAELRDSKDVLIGTGQGYVEPEFLAPGESGTFRVLVRGFNVVAPPPEPYPNLEQILGPRPTVTGVAGSPGSVLGAVTAVVQARQLAAQQEWDSKASQLVQQWEARRRAPSQAKTGNRYLAYVAPD